MKVLHVFKTYLPDSFTGVERVIWQISEGVAASGIESHVLSLSRTPRAAPLPIANHWAHSARQDLYVASTGLSRQLFGAFRRLAATVDVVHYHFPWPMIDLVRLLTRVRRPSVVTYHSDIVRQRVLRAAYRPLMLQFLAAADRLVATSPNYVRTSPVLQRFTAKTSVIPIGVAGDSLPAVDPQLAASWRDRVGERFLLFVGVLRYYKGIPFLLEAARASGVPVVIAGDGDLRGAVEAATLPNVQLVGAVSEDDKAALLQLCTGFVFPSHLRSEAFGIALVEAAMSAKPMISCEIGTGTSYVNADGETGFVVPPADPQALADAMTRLWHEPARAAAMGLAARARYERLFTADVMADAYRALYEELVGRTADGPAPSIPS